MNPGFTLDQIARRKAYVRQAIMDGRGYGWLSHRWNVSVPSALGWCRRHISHDERVVLAENGKSLRNRPDWPTTKDRLEMVALCRAAGWTDGKISRAMGLQPSALCQWMKRNAPFGLEDALEDFSETEENTSHAAAAA
jgi:hypothetical protein